MILLVFKPRVAGSCHNKTEGMLAEAQRQREKEGKREIYGSVQSACFSPLRVPFRWNGCIWNQFYGVAETAAQRCLSDPGREAFTDELRLLTYVATQLTLLTGSAQVQLCSHGKGQRGESAGVTQSGRGQGGKNRDEMKVYFRKTERWGLESDA